MVAKEILSGSDMIDGKCSLKCLRPGCEGLMVRLLQNFSSTKAGLCLICDTCRKGAFYTTNHFLDIPYRDRECSAEEVEDLLDNDIRIANWRREQFEYLKELKAREKSARRYRDRTEIY